MNYYQHHIGDYRRDTAHLSLLEHGAYRQLLDMYYLSEEKIPEETDSVMRRLCARTEEEKQAVKTVLSEFFILSDGWAHKRCDAEITKWNARGWHPNDPENLPNRPPIDIWKATRVRIFERDNYTCAYCEQVGGALECDHVVAVSLGGNSEDVNLVTSCRICNREKGNKTTAQWFAIMSAKGRL